MRVTCQIDIKVEAKTHTGVSVADDRLRTLCVIPAFRAQRWRLLARQIPWYW